MDRPLVSIIINNYNYARFLSEAINSALDQTYPCTEIVVVDDGSTDESREIVAGYGDQIVPVLKENGGQASAFNAGVAASRGEIICFLDSDDVFLREKVAEIVSVFESHQDIDWCFHPLRLVKDGTGMSLGVSGEGSSRKWDLRPYIKRGKLPIRGKEAFDAPATSGLCFTRFLLRQILPMPEATSVSISDNYIKFTAYALSKGFYLSRELALQRIHSNNTYALRDDKRWLRARILILTAYWMRSRLPSSARFTNKLLAAGLGTYWRAGGVETEYAKFIQSYLSCVSILERLAIFARALYHRIKS